MPELHPLRIFDGRTPEQLKADGDDCWPDGRPYVPSGAKVVALLVEAERLLAGKGRAEERCAAQIRDWLRTVRG